MRGNAMKFTTLLIAGAMALSPALAGAQATQTPNSDAPGATDTPTHD